jgi:hypothetical protein
MHRVAGQFDGMRVMHDMVEGASDCWIADPLMPAPIGRLRSEISERL